MNRGLPDLESHFATVVIGDSPPPNPAADRTYLYYREGKGFFQKTAWTG